MPKPKKNIAPPQDSPIPFHETLQGKIITMQTVCEAQGVELESAAAAQNKVVEKLITARHEAHQTHARLASIAEKIRSKRESSATPEPNRLSPIEEIERYFSAV